MNYEDNTDYSKIGPNPLLDPLHRIAYASLTGFFITRVIGIGALRRTLSADQLKYLWLDLFKDTTFDFFLITLHYYTAEKALELYIMYSTNDVNKINETQTTNYTVDLSINIVIALLVTLSIFYDANEPVSFWRLANRENVTLTFGKKFDLVADLLSKLTIGSTLLASDSYVLNEARRPIVPIPSRPSPS
jgi:hypothetical protein